MFQQLTVRGHILVCAFLVVSGLGGPLSCFGQAPAQAPKIADQITQDDVDTEFNSAIQLIKQGKKNNVQNPARQAWENLVPYVSLFGGLLSTFRSQVQEWRTDVETETPTSSAGTTSLVSKGSVPALLGVAVENGALTQTVNGTSVTFRTNPTGLIRALAKQSYAGSGPDADQDAVVRFIRRSSAAVTINTGASGSLSSASPSGQASTFAGSAKQISNVNFRFDIINHRDPRDSRYIRKWAALKDGALAQVAEALHDFSEQLQGISQLRKAQAAATDATAKRNAYDDAQKLEQAAIAAGADEPTCAARHKAALDTLAKWQSAAAAQQAAQELYQTQSDKWNSWKNRTSDEINRSGVDAVNAAVLTVAKDFVNTFGDDPAVKAAAKTTSEAISNFLNASGGIRKILDRSPILTFEYTDTRQGTMATAMTMAAATAATGMPGEKLPDLSNFKLIIAGGTIGGATLTGNASVTIFNSNPQPPDKGRLRDIQLSGQADIPLREIRGIGVPTLTFSGLFLSLRRQPLGMPVQVNGVNVNLKGNMGFAQAKVSFPVKKGSGVNIPLSFTYATRTELNKEHDVRGSIGVTLNLDSVFASAKP